MAGWLAGWPAFHASTRGPEVGLVNPNKTVVALCVGEGACMRHDHSRASVPNAIPSVLLRAMNGLLCASNEPSALSGHVVSEQTRDHVGCCSFSPSGLMHAPMFACSEGLHSFAAQLSFV